MDLEKHEDRIIEELYTYFSLSDLQMCAMSGTKGSSGFGSQSKEHMDKRTEKELKTLSKQ